MFRYLASLSFAALSLGACIPGYNIPPFGPEGPGQNQPPASNNPPTSIELSEAKSLVQLGLDASQSVHAALDLLGIIPEYTCTDSRGDFINSVVPELQAQFGCALVTTSSQATSDSITLTFPQGGCDIGAHTVSGVLVFTYSGDIDQMDLVLDAQQLIVDGDALQVSGGYSTCGDQQSFFVSAQGSLPGQSGATYSIDASITKQDGFPIFGSPTLIFDGTGSLTTQSGTNQLTLDQVEYTPGDVLPESGVITFQTATGHTIVAEIETSSILTQSIRVSIDGRDEVIIPLISL